MSGNKVKKRIWAVMAAVCAAAVLCVMYRQRDFLQSRFLPGWINWEENEAYDSSGEYEIILQKKSAGVMYHGESVWTSSKEMKVQSALFCDVDGNESEELILLCWKKGRYGKSKPFWVEKDETGWSQHIFVYECREGTVRPKWMSSYIGQDVAAIAVNRDVSLVSRLFLTDREGIISSWVWDSWGFTKEDTEVSFVVFGDNLIHEPIYRYGLQKEETFGFLFENVWDVISAGDIAVINQETPLVENPSLYSDYPRFGTPLNVGQAIVNAGFDVVTCGTNHALDKGTEGIDTTKNFFKSQGLICLGIQTKEEAEYQPYEILEKNGVRFALLNYTYGTNGIKLPKENPYAVHLLEDEGQIRDDIAAARLEADFVIVFVHWGTENSEQIDDFQKSWAQVFLESKADVVIGTHPHVLQPFEMLKGDDGHEMLIYYSIGNYISAQTDRSCVKGGAADFTVSLTESGYRVTEYGLRPLVIQREEAGKYTVHLQDESAG